MNRFFEHLTSFCENIITHPRSSQFIPLHGRAIQCKKEALRKRCTFSDIVSNEGYLQAGITTSTRRNLHVDSAFFMKTTSLSERYSHLCNSCTSRCLPFYNCCTRCGMHKCIANNYSMDNSRFSKSYLHRFMCGNEPTIRSDSTKFQSMARPQSLQESVHWCFNKMRWTIRNYSKQTLPNHKILLHRIIKQVHPDYFLAFPKEQSVNTTSLQYLNEWLNEFEKFDLAAASNRASIPRVGRRFQLTFYCKVANENGDAQSTMKDMKTNLIHSSEMIGRGEKMKDLQPDQSTSKNQQSSLPTIFQVKEVLYGPIGTLGVKEKHRNLCSGLIRLMRHMKLDVPNEFKSFINPIRQRQMKNVASDDGIGNYESSYYESDMESIYSFLQSIPIQDLHAASIAKDQQLMAQVEVDLFRNRIGEFLGTSGIFMRAYGTRSKDQLELIHEFLKTLENNFPGLDTRYWNRKQVRQTSIYDANEAITTTVHKSERHDYLMRRLHGLTLFIDEGHCRIDDDGSIVLGASDDTEDWLHYLESKFDPEESLMKRHFQKMVHELEKHAAMKLNISLIIAESEGLGFTTRYAKFLENIISFDPKEEHRVNPSPVTEYLVEPRFREFFDGVYLVIRDPQNAIEDDGKQEATLNCPSKNNREDESIRVHSQYGFIEAPIDMKPVELHYAVESMSAYARFISERNQRDARIINHKTNQVRRHLQLHSVQAANNLSTEQVLECCKRLLSLGSDLGQSLKGKNLVISDGFKFHHNAIEVQWNFQQ